MEARIVGLRGVGKTTLLEALSGGNGASGITAVRVVDPRIRELSEIFAPRKTTYAEFSTRDTDWPRAEGRRADMDRYLDALVEELSLYSQRPALAGRDPSFVYFGGGTPSLLQPIATDPDRIRHVEQSVGSNERHLTGSIAIT